MSHCVLIARGFAGGEDCPHENHYLKSFDFEHDNGAGHGEFTEDKSEAKVFKNPGEALNFWQTQSTTRPYHKDGKPNRPMTCLNISVEHVD